MTNKPYEYQHREGVHYESPDKILMDMEEYTEEPDSEQQKLLQILWNTLHFIQNFETKHHKAVITAILLALFDPVTMEKSGRTYGKQFGLSSNTICYYKKKYETEILKYDTQPTKNDIR